MTHYTYAHAGFAFRDMQAYRAWLQKSPSDVQEAVEKLRKNSEMVAKTMKITGQAVFICRSHTLDLISHYTPEGAHPYDMFATNDAGLKLLAGLSIDACEKWIDAMTAEEIKDSQGPMAKPFYFGVMLPVPGDADVSEVWSVCIDSRSSDDGLAINQVAIAING